jgi:hypothetical protein
VRFRSDSRRGRYVERDIYIYTYIARDERWVHGGDSEAAGAGVFDHTEEPDERLRAADGTCSR